MTDENVPESEEFETRWPRVERERGESDGLSVVTDLIAEMHAADKTSDGFRFPTDTSDARFMFGDRGIDVDNLREVMQGLGNFFECAYLDFTHRDDLP